MLDEHLLFRTAHLSDLDMLAQIEQDCFPESHRSTKRALRHSLMSSAQETWVIEYKTPEEQLLVLGTVILHLHQKTIRIYSIAVRPEFQKQGVGSAMIHHLNSYALAQGFKRITLEVQKSNTALVRWYEKQGFIAIKEIPDYYSQGDDAIKMSLALNKDRYKNIVVVESKKDWLFDIPNVEVVSTDTYINSKFFYSEKHCRVLNLCESYRYQKIGYYISLLAAARNHFALPNVTTITDLSCLDVIRSVSLDIDNFIQKALEHETSEKIVLKIFFGHALNPHYAALSRKLFQFFEFPFVEVHLIKVERWVIQKMLPLSLSVVNDLDPADFKQVESFVKTFIGMQKVRRQRFKHYQYDLAILVDPHEKNPPSCPVALSKFKAAAERLGFYTEFITKNDFHRICEFDALFIRETTRVNNHTYQFSRMAYAEGLVVMDDPWSILYCANKVYLNECLKQKRIPMPETLVLSKDILRKTKDLTFKYPVILKQPDSAFSLGVHKVDNEEELLQSLKKLFKSSDLVIAQEFTPSEFDWRIGILDGKPLFACKYYMAKGHWQVYNWKADGEDYVGLDDALAIEDVPPKVLKMALKAASLIGDGFYGIDLKEYQGEVYLIEINDNPSIEHKVEDRFLGDQLYDIIMKSFLDRIEAARGVSRYVSYAPSVKRSNSPKFHGGKISPILPVLGEMV